MMRLLEWPGQSICMVFWLTRLGSASSSDLRTVLGCPTAAEGHLQALLLRVPICTLGTKPRHIPGFLGGANAKFHASKHQKHHEAIATTLPMPPRPSLCPCQAPSSGHVCHLCPCQAPSLCPSVCACLSSSPLLASSQPSVQQAASQELPWSWLCRLPY